MLTWLLRESLGGNAKTLMFVNVNPTAHAESSSSLKFAAKVNGTDVGPAGKAKGCDATPQGPPQATPQGKGKAKA